MTDTETPQGSSIGLAWRRQPPAVKALACGVGFFIVTAFLISLVPPAWAISFPIEAFGSRYDIDLGSLAPWVSIGVTLVIYFRQGKTDKKLAVVDNKIDGMLVDRDAASVAKGEKKQKQVGEESAAILAGGIARGIEIERASVAAANPNPAHPVAVGDGSETPVKDKRVASATERIAVAAERSSEAGERVADASEKKT